MSDISIPQELMGFNRPNHCIRCGLCNSSYNNNNSVSRVCVPGEGPYTPTMSLSDVSLMIVGESPGNSEITTGYTFIGESGKHLDKLLEYAKINREDLYLTYSLKCRPPKSREPEPFELLSCRRYLEEEINRVKPKIIMALGAPAVYSLFHWSEAIVGAPIEVQEAYERVRLDGNASEKDIVTLKKFTTGKESKNKFPGISFIRGNIYYSKEFDCYIVPSFSPKSCLDSIQATVCLLRDLEMIINEADVVNRGSNKLPVNYKIAKTCGQVVKSLKWLKQNATELGVDIETSGLDFLTDEILCVSFSWAEGKSLVIPLKGQFTPDMPEYKRVLKDEQVPCPIIWNPFEWKEIIAALKDLLESPILKILQNGKFDTKFFRTLGIYLKNFVFDTMLAHHLIDENLPHDLSFLAVWYTDMGSYDLVLEAIKPKKDCRYSILPADKLYYYACLAGDSRVKTENGYKLIKNLVKNKSTERVYCLSSDGRIELKPIYNWYKINKKERIKWYSIYTDATQGNRWGNNGTRYTGDHNVLTSIGWKRVDTLQRGDKIALPMYALTTLQEQVILGSILGDGSVQVRNSKNSWGQFSFSNSTKQKQFFNWKLLLLKGLINNVSEFIPQFSSIPIYRADLVSHPYFAHLKKEIHINGEKVIGDWVRNINEIGLAVWYQDDGSLLNNKTPRFYMNDFSLNSVEYMKEFMLERFNTHCTIQKNRENQYILAVSKQSWGTFFNLVAPYIQEDLRYKLPEVYQGIPIKVPQDDKSEIYYATVTNVKENPVSKGRRGSIKTSYCIDVQDNHNFFTINEIAHNCADTDATLRVYHKLLIELKKDADLYHLFKTQVMPLSDALTDIEYQGVKINKNLLLEFNTEAEVAIEVIKKEVMEICTPIYTRILPELLAKNIIKKSDGVFNPGSPIQLAAVLFDGLKLKSTKSTETGRRSADESVLEALQDQHELPKKLLTLRKLEKFKSTYLYGEGKDGKKTGILPKMDKDGYIHTSFRTALTVTGRLSSSDPNLQNIPAEGENSKVRHIFVPKEGYKFIEADYAAAEVRVLAYVSGDPKLIERIQPGRDIHSETAADIFNIPLEEILKMKEEKKCPQRAIAKAALFGIIYGEGISGLSASAGISYEEAKRVIEEFFKTYPLVRKLIKHYHSLIKKGLPLVSPFGRKRRLYANLFAGESDEARSKLARALRQGVNAPIQGTASDITVKSIIKLYWAFKEEGLDARIVLTVHDSILIEVHDDPATLVRVNELIDKVMIFKFPGSNISFLVDKKETYMWEK